MTRYHETIGPVEESGPWYNSDTAERIHKRHAYVLEMGATDTRELVRRDDLGRLEGHLFYTATAGVPGLADA